MTTLVQVENTHNRAGGIALDTLAGLFDLVAVAFSKDLGAPGGSMLAGSKDMATVQTNIVVLHLPAPVALDAQELSAQARARGVRAVTHLDVDRAQCERAADVLVELLAGT